MDYLKQALFIIIMGLIVREIAGDIGRFSHWLVRSAARRLPPEERARFIDENLADIDAIEGPFSKLYNALGCFSAVSSLVSEHAIASNNPASANNPLKWGIPSEEIEAKLAEEHARILECMPEDDPRYASEEDLAESARKLNALFATTRDSDINAVANASPSYSQRSGRRQRTP